MITMSGLDDVISVSRGIVDWGASEALRPGRSTKMMVEWLVLIRILRKIECKTESCLHVYRPSSNVAGQPERMWPVVHVPLSHREHLAETLSFQRRRFIGDGRVSEPVRSKNDSWFFGKPEMIQFHTRVSSSRWTTSRNFPWTDRPCNFWLQATSLSSFIFPLMVDFKDNFEVEVLDWADWNASIMSLGMIEFFTQDGVVRRHSTISHTAGSVDAEILASQCQ